MKKQDKNLTVVAEEVLQESFLDYAAFVLQRRALPDARDMFKYTARQIIHAQDREKINHKNPFKKSLKSVSAATSFSYVHGSASCYGQLIHMGRPLVQRYFLEEIEGNHGTPAKPDDYAADRYTECRLSELSGTILENLNSEVLEESDWANTYDDEGQFPLVFPSLGYYNICNGSFASIGVGLASSVPQFNLKEVNRVIELLIDNPEADFKLLPDFASGGILLNPETTWTSLQTGFGRAAMLRGKIKKNLKNKTLQIYELPYGVYTDTICIELMKALESEGDKPPFKSFKDLSNTSVNIVIYSDNLDELEKWLYKNTSVQKPYTIKLTMLTKGGRVPKVLTIREAFLEHIAHTKKVYTRKLQFDLRKLQARAEILEGLIRAASMVEEIISLIKTCKGRANVIAQLQAVFGFSEVQATAIADIKTHRWSSFDVDKLKEELKENLAEQKSIENILFNEELFNDILKSFYEKVSKKFGDDRRTEIYQDREFEKLTDDGAAPRWFYTKDGVSYITFSEEVSRANSGWEVTKEDDLLFFTDTGRFGEIGFNKMVEGELEVPKGKVVLGILRSQISPDMNFVAFQDKNGNKAALHISFISSAGTGKALAAGTYDIEKIWFEETNANCWPALSSLKLKR